MYLMSMSRYSSSMVFCLHRRIRDNKTTCGRTLMRAVRLRHHNQIHAGNVYYWTWPRKERPYIDEMKATITDQQRESDCLVSLDSINICTKCFR